MPLISVLMPCYNAAPYVRAAVESVLNQTWADLELIVVDDGSTDDSYDVLASIADPRLTVARQNNRGQCSAANYAYRLCRGELIKFFDADDVLSTDHLSLQVARLGSRRDAVAMGEWARFYGNDPSEANFVALPMYRDAAPTDWLVSEWTGGGPMMQCALWLIPRTILASSGLWDERLSLINDFEFISRVLLNAKQIIYVPGARLCYRTGVRSSLSGRKSHSAAQSACLSLMLGTQHLLDVENSPRSRRACANVLKTFEYTFYPQFPDLREIIRRRVSELGGSDLRPSGPPGFEKLRPWIGWRAARHVQLLAERWGLNRAARVGRKSAA